MIKSRQRWARHIACIGEDGAVYAYWLLEMG
jgi:hypothetical protein